MKQTLYRGGFTANNMAEMKYMAEPLESYEAESMAFSTVPHLSESGTTIKVWILRMEGAPDF